MFIVFFQKKLNLSNFIMHIFEVIEAYSKSSIEVVLGKTSKISKIFEKWFRNFFFEIYFFEISFFEKKLFEIEIFRKYIRKFRKILNFHEN